MGAFRDPCSMRATMLVQEVLLALVTEANQFDESLVAAFGYDETTFNFVRTANLQTLFALAQNYVKSSAITFTVNERQLKSILKSSGSPCRDTTALDAIYSHRQVVRQLVLYLADSLLDQDPEHGGINLSAECRRLLARADTRKLNVVADTMVSTRCVKLVFDQRRLRERTYSQMLHEKREGIKDILVTKAAPYDLMKYLFSEENQATVNNRRYRLGVPPLRGRSKSTTPDDYIEFISLWHEKPDLSDLELFLLAHRQLGYNFDVLWGRFLFGVEKGDIVGRGEDVLKLIEKKERQRERPKNLACQIN